MKDYHDILLMLREPNLLIFNETCIKTISDTFAQRGTKFKLPIRFDDDGLIRLQTVWTNHLRGLGDKSVSLNLPNHINDAIDEINTKLKPLL